MTHSGDHARENTPGASASYGSDSSSSSHQRGMKEKGREAADEAKHAARAKLEEVFDRQKLMVADQAESLSAAFRKMAKDFDEQDQGQFSGCADKVAHCTDTVSRRLREQNLDHLASQVKLCSRQQPALFLGGAVAAGFFLARFFNSSQQHEEPQPSDDATPSPNPTPSSTATGTMDKSTY